MPDWALILSSLTAVITAGVGIYVSVSTRRKAEADAALSISTAAEKIVTMREKDIAALKAEIRDREADIEILKAKVLDRDKGIEALNAKISQLKRELDGLCRYVEYLHKIIACRTRKPPLSLEEFLKGESVAGKRKAKK